MVLSLSSARRISRSSAMKIIERYRVESRRMIKGSHEMVSPSRKKRRSSAFIRSVVCSQRAAMAYNRMWMGGGGCVGGGDGVERVEELQVESLISCRLDDGGVRACEDRDGIDGVVGPGGRPESAHRLRIPMVRETEEVRRM